MALHRTCPNGHRWEDTLGGTRTSCPVCGTRPVPEPAAPSLDETLVPPPRPTADEEMAVTLDPSALHAPPAGPKPTPRQAADSATDVTLDRPPAGGASDATLDVTLDVPPARPTGGAGPLPSSAPSGSHNRSTRERPRAHDQTLDAPSYHATAAVPTQSGEEYEILGELGRGGMGMVYKARQIRLNRLVALKMIRAGVHADPLDLLRFQREAEAVAQLRHPNIVQIFEVGDRSGMPYFSLEYVEGGSLQKQLDGHPRPPRETAGLIETLARAMDYAHKQGIIHRDLKPANILLTADGQPKITDFGLAKRIEEADGGQTGTGAILGTPTYMAPEQAQGKNRLIGPPADVYALGAILYDLLTGRPPFKGESVLDTLQLLQTTEPVPPTRLQPKVPRDLETICLKCLEKDPARRYGSAGELADDLRRFLDNQPIKARKVSTAERVWKWSRRRPALAALYTVSGVAVLVLFVTGWLLARSESARATTEADRATTEAALKQEAIEARDVARKEQARAETNLYRAFDAGDQLFLRISQEALLNQPAMEKVRRDLLLRSLAFYQGFLKENPTNRNVQYDLGRAQRRVASIYEKLDDPREALTHLTEAEQIFERLARENPGRTEYRHDEARTRIDRAVVLHRLERYDDAIGEHERAVPLLTGLVAAAGNAPEYRSDLAASHVSRAALLQVQGKTAEATRYYRLAADLLEGLHKEFADNSDVLVKLAGTFNNLGILLLPTDRAAAMRLFGRAAQLTGSVPKDDPLAPQLQKERARALLNEGVGARQAKDLRAAEESYARADALLKELADRYPYTGEFRQLRATAQGNLGEVYPALGQPEKGLDACEQAYGLWLPLHQQDPANREYADGLARSARALGFAVGPLKEPKRVAELWGQAADLWRGLAKKYVREAAYRVALGKSLLNRGQLYARGGQTAPALNDFAEAVQVYEGLRRDLPAEKAYLADWVATCENQARTYDFLAKGPEADAAWKAATDVAKQWVAAEPKSPAAHTACANPLVSHGLLLINRGDIKRGCESLERALPERYAVTSLEPDRLDRRMDWHKLALAVIQYRAGRKDHAAAVRVATAWFADWQKLKPISGEDAGGAVCASAAEIVGKCLGTAAEDNLPAPEKEKLRQEYGDLVMRLLQRAVQDGYRDRAALESAAHWQGVRGRADFAALLKKLAAGNGVGP